MLTHDIIWDAIDRLAHTNGYSTSGLAKAAGLDPTTFNKSKRISPDGRLRWPSTESVSRVLDITKVGMADFLEFATPPSFTIPLLSLSDIMKDGSLDSSAYPKGTKWEMVAFFAPDDGVKKIYAVDVSDETLLPVFRSGDRIILSPTVSLRRGDRVVIRTKKGAVLVREMVRQSAGKLDVKHIHSKESESFVPKDVDWISRIIWVSQ